jgi:hypothetical protein
MSSNSRSNPGKASKKKAVEDKSIRKIDHFFSTVKKSMSDSQSGNGLHPPEAHPTESAELDFLRTRCQELEQTCKDMDSQLKAVSNNQTIMHTALRASLSQREKELEELRESKEKDASKTATLLEKLVRVDSGRAAKELRQKLASDGARLGRITYTRAGLRTVETWEEGHALKLLLRRKSDLEAKKQVLLERQDKAEQAATALSQGQNVTISIDGLVLSDALTIVEAQESVRLHLNELAKDENLLKEEDEALKNEKIEHIRALKRVASEDASPFRSRPKVCPNFHLQYVILLTKLIFHTPLFCYFSSMTSTYYYHCWEKEAFRRFGEHLICQCSEKWRSRFTSLTRDGLRRRRITTRNTFHVNTKFTATFATHALFPYLMCLKSITTRSQLSWSAAREPILIHS